MESSIFIPLATSRPHQYIRIARLPCGNSMEDTQSIKYRFKKFIFAGFTSSAWSTEQGPKSEPRAVESHLSSQRLHACRESYSIIGVCPHRLQSCGQPKQKSQVVMTKTKIKGKKGRKARHVVRRQYKSLKTAAVHPATDKNCRKAVSDFFDYLRCLTGQDAARSLQNVLETDICLCDYLQHLWESDVSKGGANNVVAGVPHRVPPPH